MANIHFGKIADVWKHLPLAEILSIEQPLRYWEPHSGSAKYPLSHSWEREYGVFHFLKHAKASQVLSRSSYLRILGMHMRDGQLLEYPGSPIIAMELLQQMSTEFIFCDIDRDSIQNIKRMAEVLCISATRFRAVQTDGVARISNMAARLRDEEIAATFIHVDPYDPFERSENDIDSIELFCTLCQRGAKALLWYGYETRQFRNSILAEIRKRLIGYSSKTLLWAANISLAAMDDLKFRYNPGVFGCGIVCANLSRQSLLICKQLGRNLSKIYKIATLPEGYTGAINFEEIAI